MTAPRVFHVLAAFILFLAGVLPGVALRALAQPGDNGPGGGVGGVGGVGGGGGVGGVPQQVDVQFLEVGVGGIVRPGEWTGLRLAVTDHSLKAREVIVRVSIPDADGDPALCQRIVTLNPGVKQSVWIYFRLPFTAAAQYPLRADVFESPEGVDAMAQNKVGPLLGAGVYRLQRVLSNAIEMMGIVGKPRVGLDWYRERWMGSDWSPMGHELTELFDGLRVPDLPDRWLGLHGFSVLFWTGAGAGEDPTDLTVDQAAALREWVLRGGHLVIVLPAAGQIWTNAANPLVDIMPRVTVERRDGVPLEPYRRLLTEGRQPLPDKAILHVLEPRAGARADEAVRIMAGPDGQSVVTRRLVGQGAVTLVGFDLTSRSLMGVNGVQPDVFWHRVLGRRGELHSQEQLNELSNRSGKGSVSNPHRFDSRDPLYYDADIAPLINKKGRSAIGVLLALVVFVAYWLAAGPLGFTLLKHRKWTHHAWVAFVLACGVFTVVAWGGAGILRPRTVEGQHLTVIDHVFGQPVQRARMWASLLLPTYGSMRVSIDHDKDDRMHNALASWDSPGEGGGTSSYTDARGYIVSAGQPDTADFPARSTVKTVQVDWAGGPRWKMPLPQAAPGAAADSGSLRLEAVVDPRTRGQRWVVRGTLVHQLPSALSDVEIVVVRAQNPLSTAAPGKMLFMADAYSLNRPWAAGAPLLLDEVTGPRPDMGDTSLNRRLDTLMGLSVTREGEERAARASRDALTKIGALTFFTVLTPPDTANSSYNAPRLARRRVMHGMDLGRWFTQPCVIIQGWMGDPEGEAQCPIAVLVDGEAIGMNGRTLVRWVYPLPENPPRLQRETTDEKPQAPPPANPGS